LRIPDEVPEPENNQRGGVRAGGPRRANVGRANVRNRFRGLLSHKPLIFYKHYKNCPLIGAGQQQGDSDEGGAADDNDDDVEAAADDLFNDPKLGAKKRAKMEMKAEKKAMREVKLI